MQTFCDVAWLINNNNINPSIHLLIYPKLPDLYRLEPILALNGSGVGHTG